MADQIITLTKGCRVIFPDNEYLDKTINITRTFYPLVKHPQNPVLTPQAPLEKLCCIYGSVLKDEPVGPFRMWYRGGMFGSDKHEKEAGRGIIGVARSSDGLNWMRESENIFTYQGHPTNIVMSSEIFNPFHEGMSVFRTQFPDPAKRYAMGILMCDPAKESWERSKGGCFAFSPDGIRWTVDEKARIPLEIFDISHIFFDTRLQRYVIYGRYWGEGIPRPDFKPSKRKVQRSESPDLYNWTKPELVFYRDQEDPSHLEVYSLVVFNYGLMYVGIAQMYLHDAIENTIHWEMVWSHDGFNWCRVPGRPRFLSLGGTGEWDRFNLTIPSNAPLEAGNELWFYYGGFGFRHGPYKQPDEGPYWGAIGLATLRRDGFCSLDASYSGGKEPAFAGEVITKKFLLPVGKLYINAKSDFGKIVVDFMDESGKTIPHLISDPIIGDGAQLPVIFQGKDKLDSIFNKPVKIRFKLMNARLYSFFVED